MARLQHISIPRPPGSDDVTRAFYRDVLGLEEKSVPTSIKPLDLIWFKLGEDAELHVFAESPAEDASGRHFCLIVDDLEGMREKLVSAGYEPWNPETIHGRPRFFCRDPFGNIIEFAMIEDDYMKFQHLTE